MFYCIQCIRKRIKSAHLLLLAFLLIFGCVTPESKAGSKTQNTSSEAAKESASADTLSATGLGKSESEARNQAVAELSRIFEARVRSEAYDRIKVVVKSSGDETTEQTAESKVRVMSNVELKGVEITKTWEEKGIYYAVAAIDKQKSGDIWLSELGGIDQKIEGQLEALKAVESRLVAFKALQKVSDLWITREVLVSRLIVLGIGSGRTEPSYNMKTVYKRLAETKAGMHIYIFLSGSYGGAVKERISEALGRRGFVLVQSAKDADISIEGRADIAPVDIKDSDLKYARATVSMTVRDVQAGVSVGDVVQDERGAHLTYMEAEKKALNKVVPSVAKKLVMLLEQAEER